MTMTMMTTTKGGGSGGGGDDDDGSLLAKVLGSKYYKSCVKTFFLNKYKFKS